MGVCSWLAAKYIVSLVHEIAQAGLFLVLCEVLLRALNSHLTQTCICNILPLFAVLSISAFFAGYDRAFRAATLSHHLLKSGLVCLTK